MLGIAGIGLCIWGLVWGFVWLDGVLSERWPAALNRLVLTLLYLVGLVVVLGLVAWVIEVGTREPGKPGALAHGRPVDGLQHGEVIDLSVAVWMRSPNVWGPVRALQPETIQLLGTSAGRVLLERSGYGLWEWVGVGYPGPRVSSRSERRGGPPKVSLTCPEHQPLTVWMAREDVAAVQRWAERHPLTAQLWDRRADRLTDDEERYAALIAWGEWTTDHELGRRLAAEAMALAGQLADFYRDGSFWTDAQRLVDLHAHPDSTSFPPPL